MSLLVERVTDWLVTNPKDCIVFLLWKSMVPSAVWLPTHSSNCLILCSTEERNSYRFGTTYGWVIWWFLGEQSF